MTQRHVAIFIFILTLALGMTMWCMGFVDSTFLKFIPDRIDIMGINLRHMRWS